VVSLKPDLVVRQSCGGASLAARPLQPGQA
jgi:hypothetical protein